jgi:hypothetical protein
MVTPSYAGSEIVVQIKLQWFLDIMFSGDFTDLLYNVSLITHTFIFVTYSQ